jgi:hypothetical protein
MALNLFSKLHPLIHLQKAIPVVTATKMFSSNSTRFGQVVGKRTDASEGKRPNIDSATKTIRESKDSDRRVERGDKVNYSDFRKRSDAEQPLDNKMERVR